MFENAKKAIRARIAPTSTHLSALRGDLQNRLQRFRAQRAPQAQEALEQDFTQVLTAWGIEDAAQLPAILRELRVRLLVFILPVLVCLCAALFTQRPALWVAVALVTPPCFFGIVTTCWRVSVLKHRRFQSFTCWLWSIFGLAKKGA